MEETCGFCGCNVISDSDSGFITLLSVLGLFLVWDNFEGHAGKF